jgi:hypothetical protein
MKYVIPRHICVQIFPCLQNFCFHEQNATLGGTGFSSHLCCATMVVINFFMSCLCLLCIGQSFTIDINFLLRHKA